MHLTRESEYALLALSYLAERGRDSAISTSEIAGARELPVHFLAKILQKLRRAGILKGGRGRGRGYALARSMAGVTIGEVLEAVEPHENMASCLLWQGFCGDANPCALHHRLKQVHRRIRELLRDVSVAEYLLDGRHRDIRDAEIVVAARKFERLNQNDAASEASRITAPAATPHPPPVASAHSPRTIPSSTSTAPCA